MEINAQNLYLKQKDGTQSVHKLSDIQNLTFSSDNIFVNRKDGNVENINLVNIQYLSFKEFTSVQDLKAKDKNKPLMLFPNPADNSLFIEHKSKESGTASIEILDIAGRLLFRKDITLQEGRNHLTMDISALNTGLYLCRVIQGNNLSSQVFVKK